MQNFKNVLKSLNESLDETEIYDSELEKNENIKFNSFKSKLQEFLLQNNASINLGQGESVTFEIDGEEFDLDESIGV